MSLDLQMFKIQPVRQTFDHLARRFGNKPSSRYQEGTYDVQQSDVFHYQPTWEPDKQIFDQTRTAIRMRDWYDLKDPRQFYYGSYTMARAKQQDTADATLQLALDQGMADYMSEEVRRLVLHVLLPARHLEWGANMNNAFISAYGFGTAITAASMYAAGDRLGIAQHISRIGLELGEVFALDEARKLWLQAPEWQLLRRYVEKMLVIKDWFEVFVAQNVVLDTLIYTLLYREVARIATESGGAFYALATGFMKEWFAETSRWVDATIMTTKRESSENEALLRGWIDRYWAEAREAVTPLTKSVSPSGADAMLAALDERFDMRLRSVGL